MQFSDKYIAGLKPQDKKYYKRESMGFSIRVMPSGAKTFLYVYTIKGKRQELNLGNYPHTKLQDARVAHQDAYKLVYRGIDPKEHKKALQDSIDNVEDDTFGYFAKEYLDWSEKNHSKSWYKTIKMSLDNDVIPKWKSLPIASIKRRDAISLLEQVASRAPGQAKNVLKATRAVFEYAIHREYIEANPCLRLSKVIPDLKPVTKTRVLTDKELETLWDAIDTGTGGERTKAAIKLVLVTAQRPIEVSSMHRSQIEGNWWTMQADTVKNDETHRVYLTPMALKLIGDGEGYIFPSDRLGTDGQPRPIVRQTLSQTVASQNYYGLPVWTPHDLRRTARTCMARIGIQEAHAEAILNHKKQGVVKVYNLHQYDSEKETALLKWEEELLRIIEQPKPERQAESDPLDFDVASRIDLVKIELM